MFKRFLSALLVLFLSISIVHADKKILELDSITALTSGTNGVAVQSGVTKRFAFSLLGSYLGTDAHIADLTIHTVLNDTTTTTSNLWSASKINTELGLRALTSHVHAATDITSSPFATNGVLFWNASTIGATSAGTANQVLRIPSGGGAPVFGQIDLSSGSAVTGTVPLGNGGTGQSTQTDAMNALSPTTTKGDVLVDNGTNVIRLSVGSNDQVLTADSAEASGVKWSPSGTTRIDYDRTQVDVNNTTSETTIYSFVIPGGTLGTDGSLRLSIRGEIKNSTGTNHEWKFKIKYGSTTIADTFFQGYASNLVPAAIALDVHLFADGGTSAQKGYIHGVAKRQEDFGSSQHWQGYGTAAEDSTVNKALTVTVQLSTASTSLYMHKEVATLENVK